MALNACCKDEATCTGPGIEQVLIKCLLNESIDKHMNVL